MKIFTLIEDGSEAGSAVRGEHGLSLHIETAGQRILFDVGASSLFIDNAAKLGVDIAAVDALVLSHAHHDHGGGLAAFLRANDKACVYLKRPAATDYYFCCGPLKRRIGMNQEPLNEWRERIFYVAGRTEIADGVQLLTELARKHPLPRGNRYLFADYGGELRRDAFEHELLLTIRERDAVSLFSGCAHSGAANLIETARLAFPDCRLQALIGGFHLLRLPLFKWLGPADDELDGLVDVIERERIARIYSGHCSGDGAYRKLKARLGDRVEKLAAGKVFEL